MPRKKDQEFCQATGITCSIQSRSDLAKKELHVESLNECIGELQRKSKDWRYRTHNADLLNPDENKFNHKKICLMKKKFSEILV